MTQVYIAPFIGFFAGVTDEPDILDDWADIEVEWPTPDAHTDDCTGEHDEISGACIAPESRDILEQE